VLRRCGARRRLRQLWALLHFLMPDVFTAASAEKFEEGFGE
jgi:hypothetical protein